jgi:hypothetical protein
MNQAKKCFFICLLFLSSLAFAECSTRKKSVFLELIASPDCFFRLDPGSLSDYGYRDLKVHEYAIFAFTTGLNVLIQANDHLDFTIGCAYSRKGEKTIEPPEYSPYFFIPYTTITKYYMSYLDLPFKLDYYLTKNKTAIYLSAGFSFNIYLKTQIITEAVSGSNLFNLSKWTGIESWVSPINTQFQAGLGID